MFTIKLVTDNGYQHIYRGRDVRFVPATAQNSAPAYNVVQFDDAETGLITIGEGRVFVMNDSGKTVADYDLAPVPRAA